MKMLIIFLCLFFWGRVYAPHTPSDDQPIAKWPSDHNNSPIAKEAGNKGNGDVFGNFLILKLAQTSRRKGRLQPLSKKDLDILKEMNSYYQQLLSGNLSTVDLEITEKHRHILISMIKPLLDRKKEGTIDSGMIHNNGLSLSEIKTKTKPVPHDYQKNQTKSIFKHGNLTNSSNSAGDISTLSIKIFRGNDSSRISEKNNSPNQTNIDSNFAQRTGQFSSYHHDDASTNTDSFQSSLSSVLKKQGLAKTSLKHYPYRKGMMNQQGYYSNESEKPSDYQDNLLPGPLSDLETFSGASMSDPFLSDILKNRVGMKPSSASNTKIQSSSDTFFPNYNRLANVLDQKLQSMGSQSVPTKDISPEVLANLLVRLNLPLEENVNTLPPGIQDTRFSPEIATAFSNLITNLATTLTTFLADLQAAITANPLIGILLGLAILALIIHIFKYKYKKKHEGYGYVLYDPHDGGYGGGGGGYHKSDDWNEIYRSFDGGINFTSYILNQIANFEEFIKKFSIELNNKTFSEIR